MRLENLTNVVVRESEPTNIPFYITSSGRLCRPFNHKILDVALPGLRFCSIRDDKADPNPRVKPGISVYSESLTALSPAIPNTSSCAGTSEFRLALKIDHIRSAISDAKLYSARKKECAVPCLGGGRERS